MILPISSAISDSTQHRRDYDKILDTVSKPLMAQLIGEYQFETTQIFEDGIKSNLHLGNVDNALPIWRFLDLTPHVLYLAKLVSRVIQDDLYHKSLPNLQKLTILCCLLLCQTFEAYKHMPMLDLSLALNA